VGLSDKGNKKPTRPTTRGRRLRLLLSSHVSLSRAEPPTKAPTTRFAFLKGDSHDRSIDPTESEADEGRWVRFSPLLLVLIAVAYNLWGLRTLALSVAYPNDMAMHLQMITIAKDILSTGKFPLGQWYPYLSLGSPFFVQYQSFSAILTGALGEAIGVHHAIAYTLYLLLALWPICVYWSGRLLGWERWVAGVAAIMSPLLFSVTERGFGFQSYVWLGLGLWSQLWAMWTLPLAWGFSWRYISQRRYLFGAVSMLALTIVFHFLTAYLAGLTLIAWVLLRPRNLVPRLARALLVGALALLATLWVTVPLLLDAKWTAIDPFFVGTTTDNSYGARQVLDWLFTGNIYDYGHFPVLSIFVAIGVVACLIRSRTDERARALLAVWVLSLLLFFGRPTLGAVLDLLPGNANLLFQRYISGAQLAGLFIAGVGAVDLVRLLGVVARRVAGGAVDWMSAKPWLWRPRALVAIGVLIVALAPAWLALDTYESNDAFWIHYQQSADQVQGEQMNTLLAIVKNDGGGRVYAGLPTNWGYHFRVGGVLVYWYITEAADIDSVGTTLRTSSLMTGPEAYFDEFNLGDYSTFGVRYLLMPVGHTPPVPAKLIARSGPYELWTVNSSSGVVQVVDTEGSIIANADDIGAQTESFLQSNLPGEGIYPTIAFGGTAAAIPTLAPGTKPAGPAGRVVALKNDLFHGEVTAAVYAQRTAVVLLKASYDPGWKVTVDGRPAATEMVAPALVGVKVSQGFHTVVFTYVGYSYYPLLFGIALVALVGVGVGRTRWRRLAARLNRHNRGANRPCDH
jgi:Bacterial membrane protein YfhO